MERTAAQLDELTGVILTAYTNVEKTVEGEEQAVPVASVNCNRDTAFQEMRAVKERFGKTGGNVACHAYQFFNPGEVAPEHLRC